MPRSRVESRVIDSCRGGEVLALRPCIGLLLSGGDVAGAASTESVPLQKVVEIMQCRQGCTRRADLHADAGQRVEHPCRHHRHDAGQHLDMDEPARLAVVDPLDPDATTAQPWPRIMTERM